MPPPAPEPSPAEHALRVLEGRCDDEARAWMDGRRGNYAVHEARSRLAAEILRDVVHEDLEKETVPGFGDHADLVIYYDDPVSPSDLAIYDAESGREVTTYQARAYVRELLMERLDETLSAEEIAEIKGDADYHEMKNEGLLL